MPKPQAMSLEGTDGFRHEENRLRALLQIAAIAFAKVSAVNVDVKCMVNLPDCPGSVSFQCTFARGSNSFRVTAHD
jgi:hypothetical protein